MLQPGPSSAPPQDPLPLFRAEALAAQQQKYYGEILLIRPLSLTLLFWLGSGISATVLGFLAFGTFWERVPAPGVLLNGNGDLRQAELYVPLQAAQLLRPGQSVRIHCRDCSGREYPDQTGQVTAISQSDAERKEAERFEVPLQGPVRKITVTLPLAAASAFPEGARVQANVPLAQKTLLRWLFERHQ